MMIWKIVKKSALLSFFYLVLIFSEGSIAQSVGERGSIAQNVGERGSITQNAGERGPIAQSVGERGSIAQNVGNEVYKKQRIKNTYRSKFGFYCFCILFILYVSQIYFSYHMSSRAQNTKPSDKEKIFVSVFNIFKYYKHGWHGVWPFVILIFLLPVVLSSADNIVAILNSDIEDIEDSANIFSRIHYHFCVAAISVLITLEFSNIYNLIKKIPQWTPLLLVSLVLDILSLSTLIFVVQNPEQWDVHPGLSTQIFMAATVLTATFSSLHIFIFAKISEALYNGEIDIPEWLYPDTTK